MQDLGLGDIFGAEEEEEGPPALVQASSSSYPDEAVSGPSSLVPQDNFRAHQELFKRVASNLGLEVEVLRVLT